jgi:hypothetical protein
MVKSLVASLFILSFASFADEKLCDKVIGSEYFTNTDIYLELEGDELYRANFGSHSTNEFVSLPVGSTVRVLNVYTYKSKCSRPHSDDFKVCWLDQTKASFASKGKVFTFVVYSPPVTEYSVCTSVKERLSWAVNTL